MIKGKLYVDFDCVTVNTMKAIVSLYNEDFMYYKGFQPVDWKKVKTYEFSECTLAKKEVIDSYFNQPRFFNRLEFLPYGDEALLYWSHYYEIYIVSHGYSPNLVGKERWLGRNMSYITDFIGVNMKEHHDKSSVDMSDGIFIDDRTDNLTTSNAMDKICFGDYEWNKDWHDLKAHNWGDVDYQLRMLRKEF